MSEENVAPLGRERLVLGFDAGCMSCSDLARRIEEQVGDKLEVLSLHNSQVENWRKQVLGENAPWAPTLIEVKNGKVKAWTGLQMGVALSRRLGPAATWRVMQVLGERETSARPEEKSTKISGVSRGQFLKGAAGGLVALSILPASQTVAFGKERPAGSNLTPLQLAERTYGITPEDLIVTNNTAHSAGAIRESTTNAQVRALIASLESSGLRMGAPRAQLVEVPLGPAGKKTDLMINIVSYPLSKNGRIVGAAHRLWGPEGQIVSASFKRDGGSVEIRGVKRGKIERATYDRSGRMIHSTVPPAQVEIERRRRGNCRSVCYVLCNSGAVTDLGTCVAACIPSAVAEEICTPLCLAVLGLGCLFGCNRLCSIAGR